MTHSSDIRTTDGCDRRLDEELAETFPASDPPSIVQPRKDATGDPEKSVSPPRGATLHRVASRFADALESLAARLRARA